MYKNGTNVLALIAVQGHNGTIAALPTKKMWHYNLESPRIYILLGPFACCALKLNTL